MFDYNLFHTNIILFTAIRLLSSFTSFTVIHYQISPNHSLVFCAKGKNSQMLVDCIDKLTNVSYNINVVKR